MKNLNIYNLKLIKNKKVFLCSVAIIGTIFIAGYKPKNNSNKYSTVQIIKDYLASNSMTLSEKEINEILQGNPNIIGKDIVETIDNFNLYLTGSSPDDEKNENLDYIVEEITKYFNNNGLNIPKENVREILLNDPTIIGDDIVETIKRFDAFTSGMTMDAYAKQEYLKNMIPFICEYLKNNNFIISNEDLTKTLNCNPTLIGKDIVETIDNLKLYFVGLTPDDKINEDKEDLTIKVLVQYFKDKGQIISEDDIRQIIINEPSIIGKDIVETIENFSAYLLGITPEEYNRQIIITYMSTFISQYFSNREIDLSYEIICKLLITNPKLIGKDILETINNIGLYLDLIPEDFYPSIGKTPYVIKLSN